MKRKLAGNKPATRFVKVLGKRTTRGSANKLKNNVLTGFTGLIGLRVFTAENAKSAEKRKYRVWTPSSKSCSSCQKNLFVCFLGKTIEVIGKRHVIATVLLWSIGASQLFGEDLTDVTVDTGLVKRQMAGGMGASWHVLCKELPGHRGSAWGGNPPLENVKAWALVERHAKWLGLDWIRVELDQRMYEPEKGKFDWENEEMRTLYRVLDWCEANHADVFLQQMWNHVEWNALPGVEPLRSIPRSMDDFGEGVATLADHLINKKKYTCIRWLCINNEPEHGHCWWIDEKGAHPLSEGLRAVRKALDAKGIHLPLSGPDWGALRPHQLGQIDFDDVVGAYDAHTYSGANEEVQKALGQWTEFAHQRNKPFFLTEFGNFSLGVWKANPGPRSYGAALSNVETILRGLAVGVDGFNRWSFLNRGDLDGQWQLVRTWDIEGKRYLDEAIPEATIYNGFGMMTRLSAKHSAILDCTTSDGQGRVLAGALRSPKGNLTLWVLNLDSQPRTVRVNFKNLSQAITLSRYQVTEGAVLDPAFALKPEAPITLSGNSVNQLLPHQILPPWSITAWSYYNLNPEDPGIIEDN